MPSFTQHLNRPEKSTIAAALAVSSLLLVSFLHVLEADSFSSSIEKYSTLQHLNDIDQSIERRAKATASADKCDNMFLYLPDMDHFSAHGHGSQLNTYILAVLIGTYLNRNVLILDPPNDKTSYAGGSQFGCPVDAFEEDQMHQSQASSPDSWKVKEDFPGGFARLLDQPTWLSGGCPIPCADTYTYNDWVRFASSPAAFKTPITCEENGQTVTVIATSGRGVRGYFDSKVKNAQDQFVSSQGWAMRLGATSDEAEIFSTLSGKQMWDYAVGLMNKAGFMRLQPWIARDVEAFLQSFNLHLHRRMGQKEDEAYDAIHVRRGDKLIKEARGQVERYWQGQRGVAPKNYIPFIHYLNQFREEECPANEQGEVERIKRIVYIATDDPVVVKEEIANLPNRIDERTILWKGCHELSFYFNPTEEKAFHLNGDGEGGFHDGSKDNCIDRYHRNIASVADMMILAKSRTFVGEFNSNWGRFLRTMRVRLEESGEAPKYSKTLDTRIAWGVMEPRLPGW